MRVGIIGRADRLLPRLAGSGLEPVLHGSTGLRPDGVPVAPDYPAFFELIEHPRLFLLDLDPGPDVDRLIDEAYVVMEPGDIVADFTGSYWGDTLRRYRRMRHRSLFYLDCAFLEAAGAACLLAAGDGRGIELAQPALERLAGALRFVHAGEAGAAHYALMLHDAWRTALAHAASEVQQALEAYPNQAAPDLVAAVTGGLGDGLGPRAAWLLDDAVRLEAATPLLGQAVMLEAATALEELRSGPPPPRVGPFVHPDDLL